MYIGQLKGTNFDEFDYVEDVNCSADPIAGCFSHIPGVFLESVLEVIPDVDIGYQDDDAGHSRPLEKNDDNNYISSQG